MKIKMSGPGWQINMLLETMVKERGLEHILVKLYGKYDNVEDYCLIGIICPINLF